MDRAVSKEPPFGMWDLRFESRFLQQRVREPSVPLTTNVGMRAVPIEFKANRMNNYRLTVALLGNVFVI